MKFVFFGLSLSSSWGNGHATTYRSLLNALGKRGHDIVFYERDVSWYAENRDLAAPDFCRLELYDDVFDVAAGDLAAADAVVIGSYVEDTAALASMVASRYPALLAFYDIDTPVTVAKLEAGDTEYLAPEIVPLFDVYLSFTGGPIMARIEERFGAATVRLVGCSADTALYAPQERDRKYVLGYLGTYDRSRQPSLERLLIEPARRMPEERFIVAGPQYPDDIDWPDNVERIDHLPPAQHAGFYNALEFALNVTRAEMVAAGYSPSVRIFEAAACGRPVITDEWAGIGDFFEPGAEVLVATSSEEVVNHLRTSPEERGSLAKAGYARVLRDHTADVRAREFEAALQEAATVEPVQLERVLVR